MVPKKMCEPGTGGYWVAFAIWLVFIIIGSCLMGLATPTDFTAQMFVAGFALIMVAAVAATVFVTWFLWRCMCS